MLDWCGLAGVEFPSPTSTDCPRYQAWIFSATVRDNILAGMPYDEDWYKRVVDACALQADFAQLPASDMSEIGERGVTLSGGAFQPRAGV